MKLISFGGGAGGKKRIRRIRWWKFGADAFNFVFEKIKECVGKGWCIWGLWKWVWRIPMKNCVEGFPECARIDMWFSCKIGQKWKLGFRNEESDRVAPGSEFHAVRGRLPTTSTSLKSATFSLGLEIFGINPWCVGSLDNSFGSVWGMDVENGFEGGGKLICKVGGIGGYVCVERGSEDVTFEIFNTNGIVRTVLNGIARWVVGRMCGKNLNVKDLWSDW